MEFITLTLYLNDLVELANGESIYLKSFNSNQIESFVDFVRSNNLAEERIHATGGGAYKYAELFDREFTQQGIEVLKHDEMASMVNGLSFILKYANRSSFSVPGSPSKINNSNAGRLGANENEMLRSYEEEKATDFPKLLVTIGSGVSLIKVNDINNYERVGGTMIGGGTLMGLSNLLTGIHDFDTIIEKAQAGQNANVDMLVSDIYGENSPFKELAGDLLASSFAKVAQDQSVPATGSGAAMENQQAAQGGSGNASLRAKYQEQDVLSSLVTMISFNIGQLAYFNAKLHNIRTIYFVGSYVRNNTLGQQ